MRHFIIGTAGHVDHGKTVLVEKLTGINTDRLKEEKDRGISIELGFASLTLDNGQTASIIDVPGHERFIKNMLAGVGGIDMVMLVVAADEGVMPQTREHLDIIQLLQINRGIIVLTKIDLVDEELLELVEEDVRELIAGTVLADAPVIKVSAIKGQGIDQLRKVLTEVAATVPARVETGFPRLPIDRVFSVTGFGTVVTGTLVSGSLAVGENVEIYPQGIKTRIRSLQVHGRATKKAQAGQRVAVNLTGVETDAIKRGDVLASPGSLRPWNRLDVKMHLLRSAPRPLKNRARVRVYLGTAEILSRVILLDREELEPGQDCYVQLLLEKVASCARNDRFVIRSYSPMRTIGGGKIIDPLARKHRRFQPEVLEALQTREKGTPAQQAEQYLSAKQNLMPAGEIDPLAEVDEEEREKILKDLADREMIKLIPGEPPLYAAVKTYHQWAEQITGLLKQYHHQYPLRDGYPKEELRSRKFPALPAKYFQQLLQAVESDGLIKLRAQSVSLPEFYPQPNDKQRKDLKQIEDMFLTSEFQPPTWGQVCQKLNLKEQEAGEYLQYLLREEILIKVADNIYFHRQKLTEATRKITGYLQEKGEISIGEARDILQTSRKFTLPLLEYLDANKITRRVGDLRVAGKALDNVMQEEKK